MEIKLIDNIYIGTRATANNTAKHRWHRYFKRHWTFPLDLSSGGGAVNVSQVTNNQRDSNYKLRTGTVRDGTPPHRDMGGEMAGETETKDERR